LQGNSFEERLEDLALGCSINVLLRDYAGIGSVCGRGIQSAINTVQFYANQLPSVKYHAFGMHIKAPDDPIVFSVTRSWDSYSWSSGVEKEICYQKAGERKLFGLRSPVVISLLAPDCPAKIDEKQADDSARVFQYSRNQSPAARGGLMFS
jgi:hypothetical protein